MIKGMAEEEDYVKIDLLIPLTPPSSESRLEKRGYDLRKAWARPEVTQQPTAPWSRAVLRQLAIEFPEYTVSAILDGPLPLPSMDLSAELLFVIATHTNTIVHVAGQQIDLAIGDAIAVRVDRLQEICAPHYLFVLLV